MLIFLSSYGRDSVEPAVKPGETALVWIFLIYENFFTTSKSFICCLYVCICIHSTGKLMCHAHLSTLNFLTIAINKFWKSFNMSMTMNLYMNSFTTPDEFIYNSYKLVKQPNLGICPS